MITSVHSSTIILYAKRVSKLVLDNIRGPEGIRMKYFNKFLAMASPRRASNYYNVNVSLSGYKWYIWRCRDKHRTEEPFSRVKYGATFQG